MPLMPTGTSWSVLRRCAGRAGAAGLAAVATAREREGDAAAAAEAFDGQWLWTDASGRTQPQVTLFDGLYSAGNPHLAAIESSYKALALQMREGECNECHVPNNPNKMKQLVLPQTPAHAAGEIKLITDRKVDDVVALRGRELRRVVVVQRTGGRNACA